MSESSDQRSAEFLKVASQFKLGTLVTESSHPATATLSEAARTDVRRALDMLFQAERGVVEAYGRFAKSGRAVAIKESMLQALRQGGRIFFTGCGSTGRLSILLDSIWREFWQQQATRELNCAPSPPEWEERTVSVMAGGDFALIRSVEGFEDFTAFGKRQMQDLGISARDVVFAITEGGETSFVIGTAWAGVEAGAKVWFVYNNPDDVLCEHVERSREVIQDGRIEKLNLTTGPMAITGSTRMQATSIQLCVMLTVMEMVLRDMMKKIEPDGPFALVSATVPPTFYDRLLEMTGELRLPAFLAQLAPLVEMEEQAYRNGRRVNYYADRFALDVLTDTTERSPTYCTPPFRKFDDDKAAESWAFLFTPEADTGRAWQRLLKRSPRCVEWSANDLRGLVSPDRVEPTLETIRKISRKELLRFRIGGDGHAPRTLGQGDGAIAVLAAGERQALIEVDGFAASRLREAAGAGAATGLIWVGPAEVPKEKLPPGCLVAHVPIPHSTLLLRGVQRVALKMTLNALSTCTMVRLGRVMGNTMIWVVPGNLKLIDRATRYIARLAELEYEPANRLLFEVIEFVEPRMTADKVYPPVVGLAVIRAKHGLGNEAAEKQLMAELGMTVR